VLMEFVVEGYSNVPEDHIVSVRLGEVRRQAPLARLRQQHLKFPYDLGSVAEPMRIDIYQKIADARVVLASQDKRYSVPLAGKCLTDDAAMELGFQVRARHQGAVNKKGSAIAATTDSFPLKPESAEAQAARHYLDTNGLLCYVQAMLHAVIQDRPEDPYDYMRRQMQLVCEQRNEKAGVLEKTEVMPAVEKPKKTDHQSLEDARVKLHSARENGSLETSLTSAAEQQVASNRPPRDVHLPDETVLKVPVMEQPADGQQPMKETLAATMPQPSVPTQQETEQVEALEETVPKKLGVEQPTAGQPKVTLALTALQPSGPTQQEVKQQEAGLDGEQPQLEDGAFDDARRFLKEKLHEAFENGEMARALRRVQNRLRQEDQISREEALPVPPRPDPPGPPAPRPEIQIPYPDTPHPFIVEDSTGPPPHGLLTPPAGSLPIQPPIPQGAPPTLPAAPVGTLSPEEVEQVRIQLQNLFESTTQSGKLNTVINALFAREAGGHGPSVSEVGGQRPLVSETDGHRPALDLGNSSALQTLQTAETICQVLEHGLQDGTLDDVLCRLRRDANPQINASRNRIAQVLERAVADGSLEAFLEASFEEPGA